MLFCKETEHILVSGTGYYFDLDVLLNAHLLIAFKPGFCIYWVSG